MARIRKFRLITLSAATALALQSLISIEVLAAIALKSGAVNLVTICTGDGYEQIALNADNEPVTPLEAADHCPACILAGPGPAALPAEPGTPIRGHTIALAVPVEEAPAFAGRAVPVPQSRAPPRNALIRSTEHSV